MLLISALSNIWSVILFFVCVVLPFFFTLGFLSKVAEMREEQAETAIKPSNDKLPPKEEMPAYEAPREFYRTVKKEAGSYTVVGPDNKEAIVIRVETPNDGKYWIAILADKEGKKSDRVGTKKEAVALAVELLKENKGN